MYSGSPIPYYWVYEGYPIPYYWVYKGYPIPYYRCVYEGHPSRTTVVCRHPPWRTTDRVVGRYPMAYY